MTALLALLGAILALFGLVGMVRPSTFLETIAGWPPGKRWTSAIVSRLVLGGTALAAAADTLHPPLVMAFGWLVLVAAIALLLIGPRRLDAMVDWWLRMPAATVAFGFALGVLLGAFLVYTALW